MVIEASKKPRDILASSFCWAVNLKLGDRGSNSSPSKRATCKGGYPHIRQKNNEPPVNSATKSKVIRINTLFNVITICSKNCVAYRFSLFYIAWSLSHLDVFAVLVTGLVMGFIYTFWYSLSSTSSIRIGVLVQSSFANDYFRRISATF